MGPSRRRQAVNELREAFEVSERVNDSHVNSRFKRAKSDFSQGARYRTRTAQFVSFTRQVCLDITSVFGVIYLSWVVRTVFWCVS